MVTSTLCACAAKSVRTVRTHTATSIATFLCCLLLAEAESKTTDTQKNDAVAKISNTADNANLPSPKSKLTSYFEKTFDDVQEWLDKYFPSDEENERTFDFFSNGNENTKTYNFSLTLPIKKIDGYTRVQFFQTCLESKTESTQSDERNPCTSYLVQIEGDIPKTFLRYHFEFENDTTIDTDPHVHLSSYNEDLLNWLNKDWLKGGVGVWSQFDQVSKDSNPDNDRHRKAQYGLRAHLDIKFKWKALKFSTEIEYLPQLRTDSYEYSIRTSPEVKIDFTEHVSLLFTWEVDYYSDNKRLTIEPVFDLFKPVDTSWTHLWRVEF